jgi:hypothetical protein
MLPGSEYFSENIIEPLYVFIAAAEGEWFDFRGQLHM